MQLKLFFDKEIFERLKKHYKKIDCKNEATKKRIALERRINAGYAGWQTRLEKKLIKK